MSPGLLSSCGRPFPLAFNFPSGILALPSLSVFAQHSCPVLPGALVMPGTPSAKPRNRSI